MKALRKRLILGCFLLWGMYFLAPAQSAIKVGIQISSGFSSYPLKGNLRPFRGGGFSPAAGMYAYRHFNNWLELRLGLQVIQTRMGQVYGSDGSLRLAENRFSWVGMPLSLRLSLPREGYAAWIPKLELGAHPGMLLLARRFAPLAESIEALTHPYRMAIFAALVFPFDALKTNCELRFLGSLSNPVNASYYRHDQALGRNGFRLALELGVEL